MTGKIIGLDGLPLVGNTVEQERRAIARDMIAATRGNGIGLMPAVCGSCREQYFILLDTDGRHAFGVDGEPSKHEVRERNSGNGFYVRCNAHKRPRVKAAQQ